MQGHQQDLLEECKGVSIFHAFHMSLCNTYNCFLNIRILNKIELKMYTLSTKSSLIYQLLECSTF